MSHELIYTSARKGLKLGSRGFCTVASTDGMAKNLADRLESLSGYRHLRTKNDGQSQVKPVNYTYVTSKVGGQTFHILGRIADAGLDYTHRSNKLAHLLALDGNELVDPGPAWLLSQSGLLKTEWTGEPRLLRSGRVLPQGQLKPTVCNAWKQATGDAGWAGVFAQTILDGAREAYLIYQPGTDLLPLILEAQALLPAGRRWDATFSTYFTEIQAATNCCWRCVVQGTPEAARARKSRQTLVLDLTTKQKTEPAGELAEAARTGKVVATPRTTIKTTPDKSPTRTADPGRKRETKPGRELQGSERELPPDMRGRAKPMPPPVGGGNGKTEPGIKRPPTNDRTWLATALKVAASLLACLILLGIVLYLRTQVAQLKLETETEKKTQQDKNVKELHKLKAEVEELHKLKAEVEELHKLKAEHVKELHKLKAEHVKELHKLKAENKTQQAKHVEQLDKLKAEVEELVKRQAEDVVKDVPVNITQSPGPLLGIDKIVERLPDLGSGTTTQLANVKLPEQKLTIESVTSRVKVTEPEPETLEQKWRLSSPSDRSAEIAVLYIEDQKLMFRWGLESEKPKYNSTVKEIKKLILKVTSDAEQEDQHLYLAPSEDDTTPLNFARDLSFTKTFPGPNPKEEIKITADFNLKGENNVGFSPTEFPADFWQNVVPSDKIPLYISGEFGPGKCLKSEITVSFDNQELKLECNTNYYHGSEWVEFETGTTKAVIDHAQSLKRRIEFLIEHLPGQAATVLDTHENVGEDLLTAAKNFKNSFKLSDESDRSVLITGFTTKLAEAVNVVGTLEGIFFMRSKSEKHQKHYEGMKNDYVKLTKRHGNLWRLLDKHMPDILKTEISIEVDAKWKNASNGHTLYTNKSP